MQPLRRARPFRAHELRRRGLRLLVEHTVLCVTIWLARWQCRKCQSSLPITPAFVLPYKRYAGPTLLHLAGSYLENDGQSYRETASPGKRATGYQPPPGSSAMEERALHHSTIWCVLTWLGVQSAALAAGRQLIQERCPASTCHRFAGAVAPQKFRSPQREQLLRCAASAPSDRRVGRGIFREVLPPFRDKIRVHVR